MAALIAIKGVSKTYQTLEGSDLLALKDISFEVGERQFISIVGASGSGKTTLLQILAGLIPKSAGEIRLRGASVEGPQSDIGFVFQQAVLLPWRTVLENLMLPVEVMGLDRTLYRQRARDLLALVGLSGFENKYPFELSGGMQQRVSISRALVYDPSVLLMDEPFGALDAMTRETMNLELLRIWEESRKTIVFVTHSIPEAAFLSDAVVALTPRPGQVADIVPVDLPRPRHLDMMQSDAFGRHTRRIRSLLGQRSGGGIE
jgi:NitT/TauT family transport system ATP-binding protein